MPARAFLYCMHQKFPEADNLTLAIEGSGTGIWDRNVATGEIHYSPTWKAMLGYADSEISNRIEDSYTRVHPDDLALVQATIQAHFEQKTENYAVEHRLRCKDGSYKWVMSRGKVISRDSDGKPLRMTGTTTDISAMREMSERLRQTQNQLLQSEKLAAIGQLAAGVAHEINNPLAFLSSNVGHLVDYIGDLCSLIAEYERGEAQLAPELQASIKALKDKIDIDFIKADVPQLLEQSRGGIDRVQKIIRSLRDFSRIDVADQWHACDIHSGIEHTLNIVAGELSRKAIVHKEFDRSIPDIVCAGSQINQVILNLLMNAAHSIHGSGDIWIRTGARDGQIFIEIADNGAGIEPEIQARIFEPFFTTEAVGKGTGLGLSVSYGIIQKHGGRIDVKSEPGQGTTFTIWLPLQASPPP